MPASLSEIGPVLFGEVLFDLFPDGSRVLGGAPFNVAWHLHAFGSQSLFISSVGADLLGDEILARLAARGMRTDAISRSASYPTGTVSVQLLNGQPSFTINADQAYDHLTLPSLDLHHAPLLYCGSLALRTGRARDQFSTLCDISRAPVFVDVNLRPPWWNTAILNFLLARATWFKCNADELHTIATALSFASSSDDDSARQFFSQFTMRALIVTHGARGAVWYDRNGTSWNQSPPHIPHIIDTVGAGDAFSAVAIHGLLSNLAPPDILARAVTFAAHICTIRGATGA